MLNTRDLEYAKTIFEYNKGCNEFVLVNNVMRNKNLVEIFYTKSDLAFSKELNVYDYMLWLRKLRKFLYPACSYKIVRRKTPKSEHNFKNMSLYEFYNKGC